MKKRLRILSILMLLVFMTAPSVMAITLEFNPDPVDIVAGTSFSVDLLADIQIWEAVVSWELDLIYDPTLLSLDGITIGSDWDWQLSSDFDGLGGLRLPPFSVYGDEVLLAELAFTCLGVGVDNIGLSADSNEGFITSQFNPITNTFDSVPVAWQLSDTGTINQVAPVPEPSTMILLGTGLFGVLGVQRVRSRKRLSKK